MAEPVYRRVVIKLSGEYLAGSHSFGIDQPTVDRIAEGDAVFSPKLAGFVLGLADFVRQEEAALNDSALPPARREQVRRYFNELRKRFEPKQE